MRTPVVLGVATTTGVGVGLALGPFLLGWGLVVASTVAAVVFAHAANGDVERAAALVAEIVAAEPLWRAAFARYEALGFIPSGVVPADDR